MQLNSKIEQQALRKGLGEKTPKEQSKKKKKKGQFAGKSVEYTKNMSIELCF